MGYKLDHIIPKENLTQKGEKITKYHDEILERAISRLEGYLVNVDNCGNCSPLNCCQSCQLCQNCQRNGCQSCQLCQSCQIEERPGVLNVAGEFVQCNGNNLRVNILRVW